MKVWRRAIVVGIVSFLVGHASVERALAWGAIAVGTSGNLANDGFAFGGAINKPSEDDANAGALDTCHKYQGAPKMTSLCKVIKTFRNQCYSLAFDPQPGMPGTGWAIAAGKSSAELQAMANCQATAGRNRRQFCKINQTYCDSEDLTRCINASGDEAITACTRAIRLDPKYMFAYFSRGLANLYAGDALPNALADLNQATALDPKYAYAALWLDIVGQRSNVPSRLAQAIATIDMTAWPAPVIRMFLGQMPAAAVLAAADDPDATKKKGQVCEANFYSGELALRQGEKDEAARLFRLAAADCPKTLVEWSAANAELKALGAPQ
jgi:hypothetical protein